MGRDKALLCRGSRPLIEGVAASLLALTESVALVGPLERYGGLGFDCLPDLRSGCGPLGGIEAALAAGRCEYNLIVACDMPGICAAWARCLLAKSKETGALCVAARDAAGRVHPLFAVYRTACLPVVRAMLDSGKLKLQWLLEELNAITIDIGGMLWNLNTVEEWEAWVKTSPDLWGGAQLKT